MVFLLGENRPVAGFSLFNEVPNDDILSVLTPLLHQLYNDIQDYLKTHKYYLDNYEKMTLDEKNAHSKMLDEYRTLIQKEIDEYNKFQNDILYNSIGSFTKDFIQTKLKLEREEANKKREDLKSALNWLGMIPFAGAPFAIFAAKLHFEDGEYFSGSLNLAGIIPFGSGLKGLKFGFNFGKIPIQQAKIGTKALEKVLEKAVKEQVAQKTATRLSDAFKATFSFVNCFPANTPVSTENGLKNIQDITINEKVWSYDILNKEWRLCRVLDTFSNEHDGDMVAVTVAGETIESTGHHPWWVVSGENLRERPQPDHVPFNPEGYNGEGRWVDAIDLQIGDVLLLRSGEQAAITELVVRQAQLLVYNFHVEELHCYAVGGVQVLVHNNYLCNNKSIAGKSPSRVRSDIPASWKLEKTNRGHGWKMVDENGIERLRYMYPDKNGFWLHERTGYFRRLNEKGEWLDVHGKVVKASDILFNQLTHIIPEN